MGCLTCMNLRQAFESKLGKYVEARSAPYYRVSTELAAHKNVDMERAWSDLEEHQLVCVSAGKVRRLDQPHDETLHSTSLAGQGIWQNHAQGKDNQQGPWPSERMLLAQTCERY
jgi:hypothetical protein